MADGLFDPGVEELVDRSLGAVLDAVEAVRQPDAHEVLEHVGFDDGPGEVPALLVVEVDRFGFDQLDEVVDGLGVAAGVAQLLRLALVAEDGHGDAPALTGCADHVGGRHAGAVEGDLAELAGDAVDHLERALLDAGLVHADGERRQALVLRDVRVGAGQQEAPVGQVRVARPHLVAGDDVLVAVAHARGCGATRGRSRRRVR